MALVKSNLCPTCGGLLDIDLDKQMYVCTFCGVSFDYEYFREDNVKDVAAKAIRRHEFGAAKDAYEFMLTKNPHDFEALRGLFICKNRWPNMSIMKRDNEVHVSADEPTLKNAIENCLPEDRPYFETVREALKELQHYRDLIREDEDIIRRKSVEQTALGVLKSEYYHNSRRFSELYYEVLELEPKQIEAVFTFAILLPLVLLGFLIYSRAWEVIIFFALLIGTIIGGYHIIKAVTAKSILKQMVPYDQKVTELNAQHEAKAAEALQSHNRYQELVKELTAKDPVPPKADKDSSNAETKE